MTESQKIRTRRHVFCGATVHEIAHKLGQAAHVNANEEGNAVYLMVRSMSINRDKLSKKSLMTRNIRAV